MLQEALARGQGLANGLRYILEHPLNRHNRLGALQNFLRWQLGSRLVPGPVVVPFVGKTRLLIKHGMSGATGSVYSGLHEFEEMGFALHLLRSEDHFIDIGANVGVYSVLAAGAVGATCIAVEPIPATHEGLLDNLRLNGLMERVRAERCGLGQEPGMLRFSTELDTTNHVLTACEHDSVAAEVKVVRLNDLARGFCPTLIKMDVEGYELPVLSGANEILANPSLLAIIVELNESGARYGHHDADVARRLTDLGFVAHRYDPLTRRLTTGGPSPAGNTIFVRDIAIVTDRLSQAPRYEVLGQTV